MKSTDRLMSALRSLSMAVDTPRLVEGFGEPGCWSFRASGRDALTTWNELRDKASETGFWPVIVGCFAGAEAGGAEEAVDALAECAAEIRDMSDADLAIQGYQRSVAECLASAEQLPFERWVARERDPAYQVSEHLRMAAFFDSLPGAQFLAQSHRESAERWRQQPPYEFSTEPIPLPPKVNRNPPQHQLHSLTCYDSNQRATVIADAVAILLAPTPHGWETPAYLYYSAQDRPPQVHVAALRWLFERFGAQLVGVENRTLEVIPRSRPGTALDALRAAEMLSAYSHCPVTSENELAMTGELAFYLMKSDYWSFCWP